MSNLLATDKIVTYSSVTPSGIPLRISNPEEHQLINGIVALSIENDFLKEKDKLVDLKPMEVQSFIDRLTNIAKNYGDKRNIKDIITKEVWSSLGGKKW